MWDLKTHSVPSGVRMEVVRGNAHMSFREFFSELRSNADFALWYTDALAGCAFDAFFWELPQLTTSTFDNYAEFAVTNSAALAEVRPDPGPFKLQFSQHRDAEVITFPNLNGDALLIVPLKNGSVDHYPHLAQFLRKGRRDQVRALWKATANAVLEDLSETPSWLSTSGLGVAWLHVRLDAFPKYYNFTPYKLTAA